MGRRILYPQVNNFPSRRDSRNYVEKVYNISVKDDETFVVEGNTVVHNCKKRENIRLEHLFAPNNPLLKWYRESAEKLKVDPDYDIMTTPTALVFSRNHMKTFILMSQKDYTDMDLQTKYEDTSLKITFYDNSEHFIVLDWEEFLKLYAVTA